MTRKDSLSLGLSLGLSLSLSLSLSRSLSLSLSLSPTLSLSRVDLAEADEARQGAEERRCCAARREAGRGGGARCWPPFPIRGPCRRRWLLRAAGCEQAASRLLAMLPTGSEGGGRGRAGGCWLVAQHMTRRHRRYLGRRYQTAAISGDIRGYQGLSGP